MSAEQIEADEKKPAQEAAQKERFPIKMTAQISTETRDELILAHLSQVRLIAKRIYNRCPENIMLDDLISAGTLGLIAAIDHFDETQGVKLKTYAEHKIRGAILDSLRSMDWAPREQRRRAKQIESVMATLEQKLHRLPTEHEVAAEIGISLAEYHEWVVETRSLNVTSLELPGSQQEEGRDLLQFVSDNQELLPSRLLERSELERITAHAIECLPSNERTVLSLYFHKELTLREIAKTMNLHESRISQLKGQALLRLRSYMEKNWPEKGTIQKVRCAAA